VSDDVKVEVSELVAPKGKLLEVLELVGSLPMTMPKSIVELIARLAFTTAYTQVTADLMDINKEMIADLDGTIVEMRSYASANEVKIREDIQAILEEIG